jgi:hypothetical protein
MPRIVQSGRRDSRLARELREGVRRGPRRDTPAERIGEYEPGVLIRSAGSELVRGLRCFPATQRVERER